MCQELLYSCHLAWIDAFFWHHLTQGCASNLINNKPLLDVSRDVSGVALFLPFSLDRRAFFWHHLMQGCASNSIDNKPLLNVSRDMWRVALLMPFCLNRRQPLASSADARVCASNSMENNKWLLDVSRVPLSLPVSLDGRRFWHRLPQGCRSSWC